VVVLAKGGRMAYSGPRHGVESNLSAQGFNIPEYFNPADFLLDVISIDHRPEYESATRLRVDGIVAHWAKQEKASNKKEPRPSPDETRYSSRNESRLTPMWIALPTLLERSLRNM
jgi:ABC-2 type transporter